MGKKRPARNTSRSRSGAGIITGERPITPRVAYFTLLRHPNDPDRVSLEKIVMQEPYQAMRYARDIRQGRWQEAEDEIAKSQSASMQYADHIIKGNWQDWTEAEVQRSTCWMCLYAEQHLGKGIATGQLPEALNDLMFRHAVLYGRDHDPWVKRYWEGRGS